MNLKNICQSTCDIAEQTAIFIAAQLEEVKTTDIQTKSLNSLVSYVDQEAEKQLVKALQALIPTATFLTEEETISTEEGEWQWIIDPLDGTTNFLHQLPFFSISLALLHQKEIVVGVVYEVMRKECFSAWKDGGAFLNGQKIQVSTRPTLGDSLIATGFPYYDYSKTKNYLEALAYFMRNTRGIRRLGSAALDLAYVACGRFDAYYEYSLNPWDVAGGAILVKEAGGSVCDFQGGNDYIYGKEIIAASPIVFEEIKSIIKTHFS